MLQFDQELWKQRAWNRLKRSIRKATKEKREIAEAQWYRDVIHIGKMKVLVDWCSSKSLEVKFRRHVVRIEGNAYLVFWINFLAVMNLVRILHFLVSDILDLTNVENGLS